MSSSNCFYVRALTRVLGPVLCVLATAAMLLFLNAGTVHAAALPHGADGVFAH